MPKAENKIPPSIPKWSSSYVMGHQGVKRTEHVFLSLIATQQQPVLVKMPVIELTAIILFVPDPNNTQLSTAPTAQSKKLLDIHRH
jgi:hypothetical protein